MATAIAGLALASLVQQIVAGAAERAAAARLTAALALAEARLAELTVLETAPGRHAGSGEDGLTWQGVVASEGDPLGPGGARLLRYEVEVTGPAAGQGARLVTWRLVPP